VSTMRAREHDEQTKGRVDGHQLHGFDIERST
jgi:hypothetical protein